MKSAILFFLLLAGMDLYAQQGSSSYSQENINAAGTATGIFQSFDGRTLEIKGTPMLFDVYHPGFIVEKKGRIEKIDSMNVDIYRSEVIKKNGKNIIALDKEKISSINIIRFGNDTVEFVLEDVPSKGSVFEVLVPGKVSIYRLAIKTFVTHDKTGAYSTKEAYKEFQKKDQIFLKLPDNRIVEIKNKSEVKDLFSQHEDALAGFFKKNKTSFKKDEDLIQLGLFLNSL